MCEFQSSGVYCKLKMVSEFPDLSSQDQFLTNSTISDIFKSQISTSSESVGVVDCVGDFKH